MRREFSDKVKLAAFQRSNGICEMPSCGAKLFTGKFTYDHRVPDQLGGDPTLENCQVICRECDRAKTRKDAGDIAKARRRQKHHLGIRKRSTFSCSKDSRFKKKINGEVVLR